MEKNETYFQGYVDGYDECATKMCRYLMEQSKDNTLKEARTVAYRDGYDDGYKNGYCDGFVRAWNTQASSEAVEEVDGDD